MKFSDPAEEPRLSVNKKRMADPVTLECMKPGCVAGEDGARFKTPLMAPGDALRLLELHRQDVHPPAAGAVGQGNRQGAAAEIEDRHQGGTGGADTHPPHDTAVWAVSDNSETKTTGHSSDTMIIVEVVLACPIPDCEGGEDFDVTSTALSECLLRESN